MPLVAKQVLQDRYEVVRGIKSGGMGAVYEAIDLKLASTPCAIKEVLCSAMQGANADYVLKSFESEMRSLATLEHPNIPRVRDYFEIERRRYIVLDLVQGSSLEEELGHHLKVTQRPMDPAVVALDMVTVLETLAYLHGHRPPIVHRDIKSANLIRDQRTGKIKLVDFGIARSVETRQVQTQVGTPGFCAPEQIAGRAEPRSDLFSVGATLFHLTTGKLPPPFAFEPMEPELPEFPELVSIVKKATMVKPSERYAGAEEMAEALRRWLRNEGSSQVVKSQQKPTVQLAMTPIHPLATPPRASNSQSRLTLAATLLALVAAGLLFAGTPDDTPVEDVHRPRPAASPQATSSPAKLVPAKAASHPSVAARLLEHQRAQRPPSRVVSAPAPSQTPPAAAAVKRPSLPAAPSYVAYRGSHARPQAAPPTPAPADVPPVRSVTTRGLLGRFPRQVADFKLVRKPTPGSMAGTYFGGRGIRLVAHVYPQQSAGDILASSEGQDLLRRFPHGNDRLHDGGYCAQGGNPRQGIHVTDGAVFFIDLGPGAGSWETAQLDVDQFIRDFPTQ